MTVGRVWSVTVGMECDCMGKYECDRWESVV